MLYYTMNCVMKNIFLHEQLWIFENDKYKLLCKSGNTLFPTCKAYDICKAPWTNV